jgi:hypothetical protein
MFGIDVRKLTSDELHVLIREIHQELRERDRGWSVSYDHMVCCSETTQLSDGYGL